MGYQQSGSVVVIDDFAEDFDKETVIIMNTMVHHRNCVVILLAQNIFCQNRVFREISLSCTYIVVFKNPRDGSQINKFAQQIAPGVSDWVVAAYHAATRYPHSYLMFDSHQTTHDIIRVRSHVLPNELPMCVWRRRRR
jgi:hypothetical protein